MEENEEEEGNENDCCYYGPTQKYVRENDNDDDVNNKNKISCETQFLYNDVILCIRIPDLIVTNES